MGEAARPRVRACPPFERLPAHRVLVRRVPDLSLPLRWDIVKSALWYLAAGYDTERIWRWWRKGRVAPRKGEK